MQNKTHHRPDQTSRVEYIDMLVAHVPGPESLRLGSRARRFASAEITRVGQRRCITVGQARVFFDESLSNHSAKVPAHLRVYHSSSL